MKPIMLLKKSTTLLVACLAWTLHAGPDAKPAPTFAKLADALAFVQTALEKDDYAGLVSACAAGAKSTLAQHRAPFEQLQTAHKAKPLAQRFGKLEFPRQQDTFKLGGHDSEIGNLHVDFVRVDGQWRLKDIWNCR
jgi:hypothetical protein